MIKKVVIAAAGKGTRMLDLTKDKPKHLIEVSGRPFLTYLFDNILEAGYEELILVVGYKKEKVKEFLNKEKYSVRVVDQFEILGKDKYGTACALECVKDIIKDENFIMVYGDHIFSAGDLKLLNVEDDYNYVSGFYFEHPERSGVLNIENGFLKEIIEKPKHYIGNFVNCGLYKFTPEIFDKLSKIQISERGEYELTDAINLLAREKKVKVKKLKDYYLDITDPLDIKKVSKFLENEDLKDFTQKFKGNSKGNCKSN